MLIYWAMFLLPALASLSPYRLDRTSRIIVISLLSIFLVLVIGLRDHIGYDWNNYLVMLARADLGDFRSVFESVEPGYAFVNWASSRLNWDIYGVNFFCAIIFVGGLIPFLLRQPNFWRTLAFAVPVLIIVIGMGATRQAAAIGFLALGFNAFKDRRLIPYLICVGLAVLFHRSAAVFFLPAWFINGQLRLWPLIIGGLVFFAAAIFLRDAAEYYQNSYLGTNLEAGGALPRAAVNILAASLFFAYRRRWLERYDDGQLYTIMAGVILLMAPAVLFAPAATDRMSMYLLPIQIAILARAPSLVSGNLRGAVTAGSMMGYTLLLAIWLFFSPFAQVAWVPYQNYIWTGGVAGL